MHAHFAKAQINGIDLSYRMQGTGLRLLLLHGGLANADYWDNQLHVFAETYKVIAIDSRGHGRSTFTEAPISYALMAADVIALLDTLGIERVDVVGWSDGGIIGLDIAIHHPERLHKLVAYGANYNPAGLRADVSENAKFNDYLTKTAADYQQVASDPLRWDAFLENIGQMWATQPDYKPDELAQYAHIADFEFLASQVDGYAKRWEQEIAPLIRKS